MSGIYIHIPFCSRRCNYCDFYLITNINVIDKFLTNLKKEISISSELYKNETFSTVFFGGGTPSLLSHFQLDDILNHIHKNFKLKSNGEISIEANPEDFIDKDLNDYKSAGINRISFGVQSFINSELKFLTRQHTAEEAVSVIQKASECFDNINIDIIYSLPSQTIKDIDYSLSKASELEVPHLSAYTLTYEERTVLYKSYINKLILKNPESTEGEFYSFVSEKLLSEGYIHYEVSNFAKEGYQCRHNLKYWEYGNYIGFGPSAHSMMSGIRWNNYRDIVKYNTLIEKGNLPFEEKYDLTKYQMKLEYIMLALRSKGIIFDKYEKFFGIDFHTEFSDSISKLLKENYALTDNEKFYLTEKGYAIADGILAKYF